MPSLPSPASVPPMADAPATLTDYRVVVRRQWWVLLIAVLLGVLAAGVFTAAQPRSYTSSTQVLVTPTGVNDDAVVANARTRAEINLDTEAQLLTSTAVVQAAAEMLNTDLTLPQLADRVRASVPPNTEVLTITFTGSTPRAAQAGADAFAVSYLDNRRQAAADQLAGRQATRRAQVETLTTNLKEVSAGFAALPPNSLDRSVAEAQISSLSAQIAVLTAESDGLSESALTPGRTITEANLPVTPSSPVVPTNLAGGGMLGLLVGCGMALYRHRRDRSLRDDAQILRLTGQPVIAVLPEPTSEGLVDPDSGPGRAYARLRNVVTAHASADARVLLVADVTSTGSAVTCDLAVALARTGAGVVVVQADPRSDTAARLGVTGSGIGLSDVLAAPGRLESALHAATRAEDIWVLTPGTEPEHSPGLLQTEEGERVLGALRTSVRWVILDGPAAAVSNHMPSLARHCDAAIVVVHARDGAVDDVIDTAHQIAAARAPMLGIVLVSGGRPHHKHARRAHRLVTTVSPVSLQKKAPATTPHQAPTGETATSTRDDDAAPAPRIERGASAGRRAAGRVAAAAGRAVKEPSPLLLPRRSPAGDRSTR